MATSLCSRYQYALNNIILAIICADDTYTFHFHSNTHIQQDSVGTDPGIEKRSSLFLEYDNTHSLGVSFFLIDINQIFEISSN